MDTTLIEINTGSRATVVDITAELTGFCSEKGDGLLSVFVPHATAGLAIFETGAGSDHDVLAAIETLLPRDDALWNHQHGAAGHGRDHVLPAFVSPSLTVPVVGGAMTLGTWQSVVLVDTNVDNPYRQLRLSFLKG
jgi:secondary thiamine-phosphate synthase enzyme